MRVLAKNVKGGHVLLNKSKRLTVESVDMRVVPISYPVRYAVTIRYVDESGNKSYIICSDNFPFDIVIGEGNRYENAT